MEGKEEGNVVDNVLPMPLDDDIADVTRLRDVPLAKGGGLSRLPPQNEAAGGFELFALPEQIQAPRAVADFYDALHGKDAFRNVAPVEEGPWGFIIADIGIVTVAAHGGVCRHQHFAAGKTLLEALP